MSVNKHLAPKVFVIVLNYNGLRHLKKCLPSLESQSYPNYHVIVVDNASLDGSRDYVKLNFPSMTLIQNEKNLGFAEGNNQALRFALERGAIFVLLLNNDTIADKYVLEELVTTAESNKNIGIVGPKILDITNYQFIHEMGLTCDKFGFPVAMKPNKEKVQEAFYVSGCAMLIKTEVLREIGFFDDKYFMFSEDLDLCWRAQIAGYTIAVNKVAKLHHFSGGTIVGGAMKGSSYTTNLRRIYLRERNTFRTLLKNYSLANIIRIIPFYMLTLLFECFIWICLLKFRVCVSLLKGLWWNVKVLKDTLDYRRKVQVIRKTSDRQIMKNMYRGYAKLQVLRLEGVPLFS